MNQCWCTKQMVRSFFGQVVCKKNPNLKTKQALTAVHITTSREKEKDFQLELTLKNSGYGFYFLRSCMQTQMPGIVQLCFACHIRGTGNPTCVTRKGCGESFCIFLFGPELFFFCEENQSGEQNWKLAFKIASTF